MHDFLKHLEEIGQLRRLHLCHTTENTITVDGHTYLNCSSNDYLGIQSLGWESAFIEQLPSLAGIMANPSSRLMTGNSPEYSALEAALATSYADNRVALVVGSGYAANSGVLPALTRKEDLILADRLVHASIIDGMQLSQATYKRFPHNDMDSLRRTLQGERHKFKNAWIATESIFSMDGDTAPLAEIVALKQEYDCKLYLDEAHAVGVLGEQGLGLAAAMGVLDAVDILIGTMGKALSSAGAFIISDSVTREVLINTMRPLIFSTALSPITLLWSTYVWNRITGADGDSLRADLASRVEHTQRLLDQDFKTQPSHIIPIMAGSNDNALGIARACKQAGFWVTPIRHPTVPRGKERVRISLTATLPIEHLTNLFSRCRQFG